MENKISFFFGDKPIVIDFKENDGFHPSTTVLLWLRSLHGYKGTKEGCGEGDCGACTVVLGELIDGKIKYKPINSCLTFLPALDGKWLITIEHLSDNGKLHKVQNALLELHGSQCGFCTPGMIMSMFALYKNHISPDRETIKLSMEGNLCRCTGYKPIYEACASMCTGESDKFTDMEPEVIAFLSKNKNEGLTIIDDGYYYFRPITLKRALELKIDHPDAIISNGSSEVAVKSNKSNIKYPKVLDLSNIYELKEIMVTETEYVFGSGVTFERIKNFLDKKVYYAEFVKILKRFASFQIRNLATIGGNIGSASPIGDSIPPLMLFDTSITISNPDGDRKIKIKDFIKGYRKTDLKYNELIKSIHFPINGNVNEIKRCYKISKRKDVDIATVNLSASVSLENEVITDIKLYYGGMAETVKRASNTENFLLGKKWNLDSVKESAKYISNDFSPLSDARATSEGRLVLASNLLILFLEDTTNFVN